MGLPLHPVTVLEVSGLAFHAERASPSLDAHRRRERGGDGSSPADLVGTGRSHPWFMESLRAEDACASGLGQKNMSRFLLNFFSARPCASVREEWVSVRVSRGRLWPASARFSRPVLIWPRASNSLGFGPGATSGGPVWRGPVRGRQKRNGIVMVKKRYSFERRLERRGAGHELRPLSEANWT